MSKTTLIIVTFLISAGMCYSQKREIEKADKLFDNLAYIDAIEIYEDVAKNGYGDEDLYRKIADARYFNSKYIEASQWYAKLFALQPIQAPEYNFRYGQSLKSIGNYEEADVLLQRYFNSQGYTGYANVEDYLSKIDKFSQQYFISPTTYNTEFSNYPAYLKDATLYVVSNGESSMVTPWTNEPTSDIFVATTEGTELIEGSINTKFNEGSLVISRDGNTLYFTRNDYTGKKVGKDQENVTKLKLYRATKQGDSWENIEELPFNDSNYSMGHPALSFDETKLYFVSDIPEYGSKGGTDIFEVAINDDGTFGPIQNTAHINTPGNEMFPFIASDATLYFSSNGHTNLGGLDIFYAKADANSAYKNVVNLGKSINSPFDDFAFVIKDNTGYFASNRTGTQSDDIFSFQKNEDFKEPCVTSIEGIARDSKTEALLANVVVSLLDENNKIVDRVVADKNGQYAFENVDCNTSKFIRVEHPGFLTKEELIGEIDGDRVFNDVMLDPRIIDITEGSDLSLILNPIFFDLDESNIRPDAEPELQKVISVLRKHPNLKIDVRSHTDSRAGDAYNLALSNRRVKSTIAYIVSVGGISRDRLTGRGYGETLLVNNCSNNSNCTETEHQKNRRSEFIVVK